MDGDNNMTDILTRAMAVKENMDPRGIKWGIFPQLGRALYMIGAVKEDGGKVVVDNRYAVPTECAGEWTHPDKAQFQIERYLDRVWTVSEEASAKSRRKPAPESDIIATDESR
jgi:hypothetical protein